MLYLNDHIQEFSEEETERIISRLPQWRRETALRYRHLQGRRENALAFNELQRGLLLEYGINQVPTFSFNQHGKPSLQNRPNLHFSLSHCRMAVGCLLSTRPCGLDIERIRPLNEALVHHTMNEEEVRLILSSPTPAVTFTRLWTQKEALLKLLGTGITDDLRNTLSPDKLQDIRLQTTENPAHGYVITTAERNQ